MVVQCGADLNAISLGRMHVHKFNYNQIFTNSSQRRVSLYRRIIWHCNPAPWTNHKKQYVRGEEMKFRQNDFFFPLARRGQDPANLVEMWRVMEIMAFLREKNEKKNGSARSERLRGRVRQTHPSHSLVSLPLTDHFHFFLKWREEKKNSSLLRPKAPKQVWSEHWPPSSAKECTKQMFFSDIIHLLYRGISFPWQRADT